MKLHRVRIENVRQFRQVLEIGELEPGINLFSGPNEAGKSTIAQAIRAAFFERYRSKSVADLRPWGDGSAGPQIEVEFSVGGHRYVLDKTFLQRPRCSLQIDGSVLDGDDAEERIADLLGFQYSQKGSSKPEHWGIPGLLWIEQGGGHEIQAQVGYATNHLRTALDSSLGEVVSAGGDEVLQKVKKQRDELLTKIGDARGEFKRVSEERETATQQLAELDQQIATYRQQVDQLGDLQRQIAQDDSERPWEGFRAQQSEAAGRLSAIDALREKQQRDREQSQQLERQRVLLNEKLARFSQDQTSLQQRTRGVEAAQQCLTRLDAQREPLAKRKADADKAYASAREQSQRARAHDQRVQLAKRVSDTAQLLENASNRVRLAEAAEQELVNLNQQALSCKIDERKVEQLRQLHRQLQDHEIRLESIATRLHYALEPGQSVQLNQNEIAGTGEVKLVEPGVLNIHGVGEFKIVPGGHDLADLNRERDALRDKYQALLQSLNIDTLEVAESHVAKSKQLTVEIRAAQKNLAQHAPSGIAVLKSEHDELQKQHAQRQADLNSLVQATEPPDFSVAEAEVALELASDAVRTVDAEITKLTSEYRSGELALQTAQREHATLKSQIEDAAHQSRMQEAHRDLEGIMASQQALNATIELRQRDIDAAQPALLQQDVERFGRSADTLEHKYRNNITLRERLLGQLGQAGAQGLEERRAELGVALANIERRWQELSRRAQALELLTNLLEAKRHALTQRLQAPLQKHLNHYLQLLFPGAAVELDENLTPNTLKRAGTHGLESGSFDELSFGAREQMALISRLAYADLLREAGKATLIMLDDALVHSDDNRLSQMKRILFDASQRHQILMFTCHPQRWRDLGVAARSIDLLRAEAAA